MRWRNTIAAGLLFVALLAWVMTNERRRVPEKEEVFGIDAAEVTALTIQRKGEEPITLEKRGEDWFITQPFTGLAANEEVERLVKAIAELVPRGTRAGVNLQSPDFGLRCGVGGHSPTPQAGHHSYRRRDTAGNERYARVSGARRRGGDDLLYVVRHRCVRLCGKTPNSCARRK